MRISDWSSDVCSSDLSGQISGNFTAETANDLSLMLRAGALPTRLNVEEQRTVGAELGADAIAAGKVSAIGRSEERRVGNECVRTCRSRWSASHYNNTLERDTRNQIEIVKAKNR